MGIFRPRCPIAIPVCGAVSYEHPMMLALKARAARLWIAVSLVVLSLLGTAAIAVAQSAPAQDRWSGLYVGGGLGQRTTDTTWTTTCLQVGFPGSQCPDASGNFSDRYRAGNPVELTARSLALAGYLGAQWQIQSLVVGVEGDIGRARTRREHPAIPGTEDPTLANGGSTDTATVDMSWDASIRARLGVAVLPSLLLYATAGPAWAKTRTGIYCGSEFPAGWCSLENVGVTETVSTIRRGWTWGGGVETLLTQNLILRGEYRVARYEATEHTFLDGLLGNADAFSARTTLDTRTVLLGLAYKF